MNNFMKKQSGNVVVKKLFGVWMLLAACVGVGSVQAQTVEYIHTDALGTPVAVTDANRNVIERSEYEPYGALLNRPITDGPGYTGHVMDAATGLTYMQQRYYDPTLGRFLSVDPVTADGNTGGNFNRYWYANNNPYRFTDPDGRTATEAGAIIGCAVTGPGCPAGAAVGAVVGFVVDVAVISTAAILIYNATTEPVDADPNGPTTSETKPRGAPGADGGRSEITKEKDSTGRTTSTTHTVTKDGEVVHGHQDHVGENGSRRRFSDDLTGNKTKGEGKQEPQPKDNGPKFPPEPVKEPSRY